MACVLYTVSTWKVADDIQLEYPIPGKDIIYDESETIDLEHVPLDGGFLIKTLALSLDPYMRGRMRKVADVGVGRPIQPGLCW